MHTFSSSNNYYFHHNGDFSGEVIITHENDPEIEIEIDGRALIEYAYYILESLIQDKLDDLS